MSTNASSSSSWVVEIQEEKMPEDSGGANEELRDGSELALRAEKKGNSSSWMVDMEKLLLEDTRPSVEMARWNQCYIYRVPECLKKMTNRDAYQPQFVSLGPLHHGETHLLPMEKHKRRAVQHVVKLARKPLTEFVAAIEQVADELEAAYDGLDDRWRGVNRGSFVQMMVTDGCFLFELMQLSLFAEGEGDHTGYADNDPVFSRSSFQNLWPTLWNDMIAMENQIPLVVLQRIALWSDKPSSARWINNTARCLLWAPRIEEGWDNLGLHLLHILHKSYCGITPEEPTGNSCRQQLLQWASSCWSRAAGAAAAAAAAEPRTPCAVELNEAGIQFKISNTESIHDVDFDNGVLSMPVFEFHDQTEVELLNLMAFEWLHPDPKSDVRSYISFVDKITESERDVALLRSKGIFVNMIGRDKAVVEMFNTLTKLARTPDEGSRLYRVLSKVNAHCKKRRNKWRAMFMNNYLSNPWVFISLVAAVILLIATIMQTIYTVVPFYTRKD
ncbi:UPF0481 protein At3g47200-like [Panicum virgatum]|uniref:Uncharacterized protein n=2 Tax=Panicum virgatum TaxID=38727 RepID=A0A8T0PLK4_PANVG|nr:UPF0481 protein At3g47200-like [Panicum virgatum]XP_039833420.1 UPF0481 protein At3g47200-like [Panicum virgatum]KAG2481122.1 hypothetical protein PVAP13_J683357 [Panicum virgatum]KAG2562500.1 hypothetical protein PVAP13_8KG118600 [Panicum virgatum]